ncbi:MAG TPA: zf-HC2 domain-containing protein [Candidatus Baltobacteraceae bacterium]|nr:zf-HC2 domain-containing protein [Candidatus Baltobacteraceae bacterium]
MHCSSCEPLLDRYLEGTLPPRTLAAIAEHIGKCEHCSALLDEVKVVDALLFTTTVPELPQNFTFAVMAEVRDMPPVHAPSHALWSFLAIYSAAAWVAAVLAMALTGTRPGSVLAFAGHLVTGLSARVAQGFSLAPHAAPSLAAFGVVVLMLDAVLAGGIAVVYFGLRPRLAAVMATSRRSGHD